MSTWHPRRRRDASENYPRGGRGGAATTRRERIRIAMPVRAINEVDGYRVSSFPRREVLLNYVAATGRPDLGRGELGSLRAPFLLILAALDC